MNKQITVFAGALVKDGKILMVLRHEPENEKAHLKWEYPGGKVDFGETPQQSVEREFMEETGIEVKATELLPFIQVSYWDYEWGRQQTLCFMFLCEFIAEHERPHDHHIADIKWFDIGEVKNLNSLPGTMEVIEIVKKRLK